MKDEIEEILSQLEYFYEEDYEYYSDINLSKDDIKVLLNYITNLKTIEQQYSVLLSENAKLEQELKDLKIQLKGTTHCYDKEEHKRLKEKNERLTQGITLLTNKLIDMTKEKEDYKLRNEKANWWLKEMLKQAKSEETKAIINGTLELLLNGDNNEQRKTRRN